MDPNIQNEHYLELTERLQIFTTREERLRAALLVTMISMNSLNHQIRVLTALPEEAMEMASIEIGEKESFWQQTWDRANELLGEYRHVHAQRMEVQGLIDQL
ncbi:hypothetical protein N7475_004316 [Penicillium sp. IBT 31633x]|nr:hypothetical protein N7475_004316 [Penicillium sp. IBT 31633x]